MSPVLSLQIHLGIPITIKNYDCISSLQVQPQPPRPRTQQENVELTVLRVELSHSDRSFLSLRVPVQPQVSVFMVFQE